MLTPGTETSTLNSAVPQTPVPMPINTRFTENVDSRLISGGRPTMRWTAVQ
jgi:hypothetical protein